MKNYFAANLRFLRHQQEMTQADFAEKLGLFEETLKRYEREKSEPDLSQLLTLSKNLGVSIDQLLGTGLEAQHNRLLTKRIKLILLDVDGTLTDGGLYYSEHGDQMKKFNVKDGMAISRLIKQETVKFGCISGSSAGHIIKRRAEALGISRMYAGSKPKWPIVQTWLEELSLSPNQVAYVGDDINDLPVMKQVGLAACPSDAVRAVRQQAHLVLTRPGGGGCIREFLEEYLGHNIG